MVRKYLKNSHERNKKVFRPKHPHFSRSVIQGDEIVEANTFDDVSFDAVPLVPYHSMADEVRAGKEPQKMASMNGNVNMLQAARVAKQFLAAFNRAGMQPVESVEPVEPVEPVAPAAPAVEPQK